MALQSLATSSISMKSSIHLTHNGFASILISHDSSSIGEVLSFICWQSINIPHHIARQSIGCKLALRSPSADQLMSSSAISSFLLRKASDHLWKLVVCSHDSVDSSTELLHIITTPSLTSKHPCGTAKRISRRQPSMEEKSKDYFKNVAHRNPRAAHSVQYERSGCSNRNLAATSARTINLDVATLRVVLLLTLPKAFYDQLADFFQTRRTLQAEPHNRVSRGQPSPGHIKIREPEVKMEPSTTVTVYKEKGHHENRKRPVRFSNENVDTYKASTR